MSYQRGVTELGPTTYAFLQPDGGWGWSNSGLIAGQGEAVLVDTFFDLANTRELLSEFASASGVPVRTLVNTHHNGDHCWGNQLVQDATIVGHAYCRSELVGGASPDFLAGVVNAPDDDGPVGYIKRAFAPFDFGGISVTPPTVTFEDRLTVHLGDRDVHLLHFGPGHTLGDIVVWVPDERVLFAGDLLFLESTPLVWEGSLLNWIDAVDGMIALDPAVVVPGHGPVTDVEGLRRMQRYLQHVVAEGGHLKERGLDPLAAAKEVDLGSYAEWLDSERLVLNLMRLWLELDGHPPHTRIEALDAFANMAALAEAWRG